MSTITRRDNSKRIHEQILDKYYKKKRRVNRKDTCSICLEHIDKKEADFITCAHFFHKSCIDSYLEKHVICPICRIPIFIQDDEQLIKFNAYIENQRLNKDLVRQNIAMNDNALALLFIRDKKLFQLQMSEISSHKKLEEIMEIDEPNLVERYSDFFNDEYDSESDHIQTSIEERIEMESQMLVLYSIRRAENDFEQELRRNREDDIIASIQATIQEPQQNEQSSSSRRNQQGQGNYVYARRRHRRYINPSNRRTTSITIIDSHTPNTSNNTPDDIPSTNNNTPIHIRSFDDSDNI